MKKITLLLTILIISSFSFSVFAETDQSKKDKENCKKLSIYIAEDIKKVNQCATDNECTYRYLACPFRYQPCDFTPVGSGMVDGILKMEMKINKYRDYCLGGEEGLKKHCEKFDKAHQTSSCPRPGNLKCVNGSCVTINQIISNRVAEGNDAYGSKGRLAPEGVTEEEHINRLLEGFNNK